MIRHMATSPQFISHAADTLPAEAVFGHAGRDLVPDPIFQALHR